LRTLGKKGGGAFHKLNHANFDAVDQDIFDLVVQPWAGNQGGRCMGISETEFRQPLNSGQEPNLTCGNYAGEQDSARAFDVPVERSGLFEIWREVTGENLHPLPKMNNKRNYRIDRILAPTEKLKIAGWDKGYIGVEIKRSGIKAGPPISQMFDYLHCAWKSPRNEWILIDYCFLWPLEKCGNVAASIMAQNRVGGVCLRYPPDSEYHRLQFFLGEQAVLVHYLNTDHTEVKNLMIGNRTGSR